MHLRDSVELLDVATSKWGKKCFEQSGSAYLVPKQLRMILQDRLNLGSCRQESISMAIAQSTTPMRTN